MTDTPRAYRRRDAKLRRAAAATLGQERLSDADYVDWLIETKRREITESSWRQYRCAAAHVLEDGGGTERLLLAKRLRSTRPVDAAVRMSLLPRTSARKAKHLPLGDVERLIAVTIASRSPLRDALIAYLQAATLTGLRPCEWPSVEVLHDGDRTIVTVENAKANDLRAHSLRRTLIFYGLPQTLSRALNTWIAVAREAGADYPTLQKRLGDALHGQSLRAFPRRTKRPSLYTPRHVFAANAKARYASGSDSADGLTMVAALLGHSTDATASHHYARPRPGKGRTYPIPNAAPDEVRLVRTVFAAKFATFEQAKATGLSRSSIELR